MTLKEAKIMLKRCGMVIDKVDGEYRVNFCFGKEATAYYTNDLKDACNTGVDMSKRAHEPKTPESVRIIRENKGNLSPLKPGDIDYDIS